MHSASYLQHVECCLHLDITASRLEFAKQLGADFTMTIESSTEPRANACAISNLLGCHPDVTIECSGAESSLQAAVYVGLMPFDITFLILLFIVKTSAINKDNIAAQIM